ncbi:hypothetical protein BDR26DRAFT_866969 [Obelidium mucronatum]|nr:hypothetical protein BDR26DRAFT_866969 [Obelidium mucronatum]
MTHHRADVRNLVKVEITTKAMRQTLPVATTPTMQPWFLSSLASLSPDMESWKAEFIRFSNGAKVSNLEGDRFTAVIQKLGQFAELTSAPNNWPSLVMDAARTFAVGAAMQKKQRPLPHPPQTSTPSSVTTIVDEPAKCLNTADSTTSLPQVIRRKIDNPKVTPKFTTKDTQRILELYSRYEDEGKIGRVSTVGRVAKAVKDTFPGYHDVLIETIRARIRNIIESSNSMDGSKAPSMEPSDVSYASRGTEKERRLMETPSAQPPCTKRIRLDDGTTDPNDGLSILYSSKQLSSTGAQFAVDTKNDQLRDSAHNSSQIQSPILNDNDNFALKNAHPQVAKSKPIKSFAPEERYLDLVRERDFYQSELNRLKVELQALKAENQDLIVKNQNLVAEKLYPVTSRTKMAPSITKLSPNLGGGNLSRRECPYKYRGCIRTKDSFVSREAFYCHVRRCGSSAAVQKFLPTPEEDIIPDLLSPEYSKVKVEITSNPEEWPRDTTLLTAIMPGYTSLIEREKLAVNAGVKEFLMESMANIGPCIVPTRGITQFHADYLIPLELVESFQIWAYRELKEIFVHNHVRNPLKSK